MVLRGGPLKRRRKGERTRFPNPFCDFHGDLATPMNVRAIVQRQELHVVDLAICVDDLPGVGRQQFWVTIALSEFQIHGIGR
jgi:hypothetical protein